MSITRSQEIRQGMHYGMLPNNVWNHQTTLWRIWWRLLHPLPSSNLLIVVRYHRLHSMIMILLLWLLLLLLGSVFFINLTLTTNVVGFFLHLWGAVVALLTTWTRRKVWNNHNQWQFHLLALHRWNQHLQPKKSSSTYLNKKMKFLVIWRCDFDRILMEVIISLHFRIWQLEYIFEDRRGELRKPAAFCSYFTFFL